MSSKYHKELSIAILAGGKNSRYGGKPKPFITWKSLPLISHYLKILSPLSDDIFIISNQKELYTDIDVNVFPDIIPDKGPLSGIHASLFYAQYPKIFILACDMPLLPVEVINKLYAVSENHPGKVLLPSHRNGVEPLFSLWNSIEISMPEEWLKKAPSMKVITFLKHYNLLVPVNIDNISSKKFININTEEDLQKALSQNNNQ